MPSVLANGLSIEYETSGDPARPPLVLVMGLGAQLIFWPDELVEMLVARGFFVVRFDNRDVGLSTSLDHLGVPRIGFEAMKYLLHLPLKAPYYIDDMARDTAAFIDALGLARAHVVGASMGGMIAQNLAAAFPEKISSLVSIMSTTGSRKLPNPTPRARNALLSMPARPGDIEGATRHLMKLLRAIGSRSLPADEAYLRAFCERQVRRRNYPQGAARQLMAIAATGDRTAVVRRIKVPTLVIHGDEDPLLLPVCGEATARAIQEGGGNVTLQIVPGMGHDLPMSLIAQLADRIAAHCGGPSQAPAP